MRRVFFEGFLLCAAFLALWGGLSRVNFMSLFHVREFTRDAEQSLGRTMLSAMRGDQEEISSPSSMACFDSIARRLSAGLRIPNSGITIHLVRSGVLNAFALPGGHMIVTTRLVQTCSKPEELCGVIAHEAAHVEFGHVMKKLSREFGLALLTSAAGEGGGTVARQALKTLSSSAFDRAQESEADLEAVRLLILADVDPEHLANMFLTIARKEGETPSALSWISTHPDTKERAAKVLRLRNKAYFQTRPLMSDAEWKALVETCGGPGGH